MWRVRLYDQPDVVVRLPRRPGAAAGVEREMAVLQQVEHSRVRSIVTTPSVRHVGEPQEAFPHHWSVLEWIDGSDAWTERADLAGRSLDSLAHDLAQSVTAIGEVTVVDVPQRPPGTRGGPLRPLLERLDDWLDNPEWNAARLIDVAGIKRLAAEALEVADEPVIEGFVHGDLIPGNLLVDARPSHCHHRLGRCRSRRHRTGPRTCLGSSDNGRTGRVPRNARYRRRGLVARSNIRVGARRRRCLVLRAPSTPAWRRHGSHTRTHSREHVASDPEGVPFGQRELGRNSHTSQYIIAHHHVGLTPQIGPFAVPQYHGLQLPNPVARSTCSFAGAARYRLRSPRPVSHTRTCGWVDLSGWR